MSNARKTYHANYRKSYKGKRVNLTLTPAEYRLFSDASGKLKVTTFIKQQALASVTNQTVIPDTIAEELKTLRFAIRNIANNVNQIAHHSNMVKQLTSAEENNLLAYIKQLEDVVQAYTENRLLGDSNDDY